MKSVYKKVVVVCISIIIVVITAVILFTYVFHINSPAIKTVGKALYLPAIIVDGHWITISEIDENTLSIKRFYENQDFSKFGIRIDFSTEDGKKRLQLQERKMINKLIEDIAIEQIADEWDIHVSDEAVVTAMERPMAEMGTKESVKSQLKNLYGWSLDDFGKKVVRQQLLRDKVSAQFVQRNQVSQEMWTRMKSAQKELSDGRDFADVAQKYSEGSTASVGGIMGWFSEGQLQDEIGKQVFSMKKGEHTDIIETPLGLHIVQVNDVSEMDGKKMVHVSQIFIKKKTLAEFLNERIGNMKVKVFLPQYKWDAGKALIVFSDESMDEFERLMYEEGKNTQKELLNKLK